MNEIIENETIIENKKDHVRKLAHTGEEIQERSSWRARTLSPVRSGYQASEIYPDCTINGRSLGHVSYANRTIQMINWSRRWLTTHDVCLALSRLFPRNCNVVRAESSALEINPLSRDLPNLREKKIQLELRIAPS